MAPENHRSDQPHATIHVQRTTRPFEYGSAVLIVAGCTVVNWLLSRWLSLTDLAMVYLLGVAVAAVYFRWDASIFGALLSFLAFDFFFVPPVLTLQFGSGEHLLTGLTLLAVGAITSMLASRVRNEMRRASLTALTAREEQLRNSLLASISHDLRTPLAVIAGSASTLKENRSRLSSEEQDQLLESIFEQSRLMSTEISDVLEMTHLHAGPVKLNREWHLLEELIGTALERCSTQLLGRTVDVDLAQDLPMVNVDGVLIEKLFVNLLENACRYTPKDSRIHIGANRVESRIEVVVEDDGPGLPIGREETMFNRFTRVQTEGASPGSGLGLSICRAIAQLHGMEMRARNRDGGGAQILLTIPYESPPSGQVEAS